MGMIKYLRNVRLIDGRLVTICLEQGRIYAIHPAKEKQSGPGAVIDGNGYLALPGFIDPHVHFRIPGGEHKADWQTESRAAIMGGVTTVFDMPNTNPPLTTASRIQEKINLIGSVPIDYRFWFGATKVNMSEIAEAAKDPRIIGVKVYMGSSTGDLLVDDDDSIRRVFATCAKVGLLVGVHAEDEELMRANRQALGHEPRVYDHCTIRDTAVEVLAVIRALKLQKETGCRLYFCHITTPEAVELIGEAKSEGRPVYVEVCPHHLFLNDREIREYGDPYSKMNPPLRSITQVEELIRYVTQTELVDCLGSDHAPHTFDEKEFREYDKVPSGVTGVQTIGLAALELVKEHKMTLDRLVALTSGNAASIFGLVGKGTIEVGMDGDLVLVSTIQQSIFVDAMVASKCGWSPFDEISFDGTIKLTVA